MGTRPQGAVSKGFEVLLTRARDPRVLRLGRLPSGPDWSVGGSWVPLSEDTEGVMSDGVSKGVML